MSSIGWRGSHLYRQEKLHGSSARRSCDVVIRPARPEGKKNSVPKPNAIRKWRRGPARLEGENQELKIKS